MKTAKIVNCKMSGSSDEVKILFSDNTPQNTLRPI